MIIVQLMGGLGNQMFQYAFGRALCERLQSKIKYDLTFFSDQNPESDISLRDFELEIFNLKVSRATLYEINHFKSYSRNPVIRKLYKIKRRYISSGEFFLENGNTFNGDITGKGDNVYYSGYWHSYKYFDNIRQILINEFTLKDKVQINTSVSERIKSSNSIGVHFRRGDYLSKSVSEVLVTTSHSYYQKAFDLIYQQVPDPHFFVFSDEPEWIKKNLNLNKPFEIISGNQGKNSYKDLILMSQCKHNIIANSSFSWWGAWLNQNKDKIVIAPEQWYKDPDCKTNDLLPNSWIKI